VFLEAGWCVIMGVEKSIIGYFNYSKTAQWRCYAKKGGKKEHDVQSPKKPKKLKKKGEFVRDVSFEK
jgi:hypothetical protein